jgi:hypothetical protein
MLLQHRSIIRPARSPVIFATTKQKPAATPGEQFLHAAHPKEAQAHGVVKHHCDEIERQK